MKAWFAKLRPRERWILIGGAGVVGVIIVWGFIWLPLSTGSVDLRASVADKQSLLLDIQRAQLLQATGASDRAINSSQSLVVLVDTTAQPLGLSSSFTATRPNGADGISVSFQNASFDALLTWLIGLETSYGIQIESASFNDTRQRGLVSGQLFLRRS